MLTTVLAMIALGQTPISGGVAFPGDGAVAAGVEGVHDPTIIQFKGRYFCFHTSGNGFGLLRSSDDLKTWKTWGPILSETPDWLRQRYRHRSLWAPDVVVMGDKLRMYYSASNWGSNQSVIGVAECENFDPKEPLKGWHDLGLVIESRPNQETYNAIDPEVAVAEDGRHWLFFGSYFAGIQLVELDPTTGRLKNPEKPEVTLVACNTDERGNPLEGTAVCRRDGYYYLFVSYGLAGQGVRSTYRLMVGRSRSVTGPYLDDQGKSMADGGHVNVLKSSPPMYSPGHSDVLQDQVGRWLMPYHFYDGRRNWHGDVWGLPMLQIRELLWSRDGWPLPGLPVEYKKLTPKRGPVGKWLHQVDFGTVDQIEIRADGTVVRGKQKGTWEADGNRLTFRWPKLEDPKDFWIDHVDLAYGDTFYVGRNDAGVVIRGIRSEAGRR